MSQHTLHQETPRFRVPRALRPVAYGGAWLLQLARGKPVEIDHYQPRPTTRLSTGQLAERLDLTVVAGHPDVAALRPHLKDTLQDWRDGDWGRLGMRLSRLDRSHAALPSGERIAPALGRALFRHLAGPAVCALIDKGQAVSPADLPDDLITPLLRILPQPQVDPTLHFLAAQFQLEMGWARRGDNYAVYAMDGSLSAAESRFRAASTALDRIASRAPHSGYYSELDYRVQAANGTTEEELTRAAARWSRTDPTSLVPYATHGLHLLPRWYGDENSLQDFADRSWSKTHDTLGAAAYAAVYLAAIEGDLEAAIHPDMEVFREGLIDMMQDSDDPDLTCNTILRILWEAGGEAYDGAGRETRALREARLALRDLFDDLARNTLGPVMPDVWGGRWTETRIMHAVASAFVEEINAGKKIAIGLQGAVIKD